MAQSRRKLVLPIKPEQLSKGGLLDRLRDRDPKRNAFAKIKNLVISDGLDAMTLGAVEHEFGIDAASEFAKEWLELLEEIIFHLGRDATYDEQEKAFFAEYIRLLRVPKPAAQQAMQRAHVRIFTEHAAKLVGSGRISSEQMSGLDTLGRRLGLTGDEALGILREAMQKAVTQKLNGMLLTGMVSDEDYEDFQRYCRDLRANIGNSEEVDRSLQTARERWRVVHGELPVYPTGDIRLPKTERVYFRGRADWHEYRKVRSRVDYAGVTGRIRIAKGVSFRMGSVGFNAPARDELQLIGTGEIVLTNKRALFLSSAGGNKSVPWRSVIRVDMNDHNEFELEKATGKSPVIIVRGAVHGNPNLSAFIASRLLEMAEV